MVIRNGTDPKIEQFKQKLGLKGDVYVVNEHLIESLESHRVLVPNSTATTIEEAELERIAYEEEQRLLREEQARLQQEQENDNTTINS